MRFLYKKGWFKIGYEGLRFQVTIFDGVNVYSERLKPKNYKKWSDARDYCIEKIDKCKG